MSMYLREGDISKLINKVEKNEITEISLGCIECNINLQQMEQLGHALSKNTSLKSIGISHTELSPKHLSILAKGLADQKIVENLSLWYCGINAEGMKYIAELVKSNTNLTKLNLRDNNIGEEGLGYLARALAFNNHLITLNLFQIEVSSEALVEFLPILLSNNKTLKDLDLGANNINSATMQKISKAISECSLEKLNLDNNKLGADGMKYLAMALSGPNCKLRSIDLTLNNIGSEGAKALAEGILKNKSLKELELLDNNIGPEGAVFIAKLLPQLDVLGLRANEIGNAGVQSIANAFKTSRVTRLDLYDNIHLGGKHRTGNECRSSREPDMSGKTFKILKNAMKENCFIEEFEADMDNSDSIKKILDRNISFQKKRKEELAIANVGMNAAIDFFKDHHASRKEVYKPEFSISAFNLINQYLSEFCIPEKERPVIFSINAKKKNKGNNDNIDNKDNQESSVESVSKDGVQVKHS